MRKITLYIAKIITVLMLVASVSSMAMATGSIQKLFLESYPAAVGTQLDGCATCHSPMIAESLNSYGLSLRIVYLSFSAIEDKDPDGDGISSLDEINAGVFPGSQVVDRENIIFKPKFGSITFNHDRHVVDGNYGIDGDCSICHSQPGGFKKIFDDNISVKKLAHSICKGCHLDADVEEAPTKCRACHVKQ